MRIIAHRGASGYAPENTLPAFRKAVELQARAVEFDVQQTQDCELVVIHDPDLRRVCGVKKAVASLTYGELSRLDVGAWFAPAFRRQRVPHCLEVLDFFESLAPDQRPELQMEIKDGSRSYEGIEMRLLKMLESRPSWSGRVVVSSFNHEALRRVRALDAGMRLGYLVGRTRFGMAMKEMKELRCESVHMSSRQVDRTWIDSAHELGRKVLIYTVNSVTELQRLEEWGVDGIFTNFPDILMRPASAGKGASP